MAACGQYGAEVLLSSTGALLPNTAVTVLNYPGGTNATLFTSISGATSGPNPVNTDTFANLTFFAAFGQYQLKVAGVIVATVTVEPLPHASTHGSGGSDPVTATPGPGLDTTALHAASNLSDLASAPTARTNLGLGTAATQASSAFDTSGAAAAVIPGVTVSGSPSTGQLLTATSSSAATWQSLAGAVTKRVRTNLGCDGINGAITGYTDLCQRWALTLPVSTTRWRLIIRNSGVFGNVVNTGVLSFTGIWFGAPDLTAASWAGDFAATPTQMASSFATNTSGAEYTSAWFNGPVWSGSAPQFAAYVPAAISVGWTLSSGTDQCYGADSQGWLSTGTGASAAAGSAALPSGGGITQIVNGTQFLDIRLEYEYLTAAGSTAAKVVAVIGDSLGLGYITNLGTNYGLTGPNQAWGAKAALKRGFTYTNMSIGGATSDFFANHTSNLCWTRWDFETTVPDAAIVALGINDVTVSEVLSTYQTNMIALAAYLLSIGIPRVYACTILPDALGPTLEALRQSYNAWLRAGPPCYTGIIDMAIVGEDPINRAYGIEEMFGGDYPHPATPALYSAMSDRVVI